MQSTEAPPLSFSQDLLTTPGVIQAFAADTARDIGRAIAQIGRLLITGEGCARIFPAKNAILTARRMNWPIALHTDEPRLAREFDLSNWAVFAATSSAAAQDVTDVVKLFQSLRATGHKNLYALSPAGDARFAELVTKSYPLHSPAGSSCAAVIEQALFYQSMLEHGCGIPLLARRCQALSDQFRAVLSTPIDPAVIEALGSATMVYFAGENDGIAEDLALRTMQVARRKAGFLETPAALRAALGVMCRDDAFVCVNPCDETVQMLTGAADAGASKAIVTLSACATPFPSIVVPSADLQSYVTLAAGWNLLAHVPPGGN